MAGWRCTAYSGRLRLDVEMQGVAYLLGLEDINSSNLVGSRELDVRQVLCREEDVRVTLIVDHQDCE